MTPRAPTFSGWSCSMTPRPAMVSATGYVVALGERHELGLRQRIAHAAAGDQKRLLGVAQQAGRGDQLLHIGPRARHLVDTPLEELGRIVEGLALHILGQGDERRPALGRVGQHRDRLRQRGNQLLRLDDAVPVAGHGPEGIVHADAGVVEMLDLLEHGIGQAVDEGIARQQQHRQPVRMGDAGRGDHVGGARPDGTGGDHDLAAALGLGEGDRGERHRLLVLAAPGRKLLLHGLERLAQAGDVAMAEDGEHAGEQRRVLAIDYGALGDQVLDQGLGHGETNGLHRAASSRKVATRRPLERRADLC